MAGRVKRHVLTDDGEIERGFRSGIGDLEDGAVRFAELQDQYNTHFSEIQLIQIFLILLIFGGSIAIFLITAAIEGYEPTAEWLHANFTVLAFLYVMPLSLIPVYSQLDDRMVKGLKQFTFAGVIIGFASLLLSIHSFWVVDSTPFQEAVFWFSKQLFGVTVFALMTGTILKRRDQ